jgi:hypothetical protein
MLPHTTLCAALLVVSLFGCAKQQEGERCDPNSGNLDCDTGLVCRSGDQLSIAAGPRAALCCPPEGVPPSVDACRAGAVLPPDQPFDAGQVSPQVSPDAG